MPVVGMSPDPPDAKLMPPALIRRETLVFDR
jgi:hypothetical protein